MFDYLYFIRRKFVDTKIFTKHISLKMNWSLNNMDSL